VTIDIPGVVVSQRRTWPDQRGDFLELFRSDEYPEAFVQFNHSFSRANVLRGLHYHRHQADLWYIVRGLAQVALADLRGDRAHVEVFDLRGGSATTVYIPPGVAHGYLAVDDVDMLYAVTRTYDPDDEHGVAWNDPELGIAWRVRDPVLSERDRTNPQLRWPDLPSFS
jgi:dTDP-4-dehydrorhamnose 3,5-epimerase